MPYFASPRYQSMDPLLSALLAGAAHQDQQQRAASCTPSSTTTATTTTQPSKPTPRAFTPNFDVIETADSYILEGELPGLSEKKAVDIEFSDDRTLMIRGRIERPTTTSQTETAEKRRSLNPTVEDTEDEEDFSVVKHQVEKKRKEGGQRKTWVSERTFGSFQRSFAFPGSVRLDGVVAQLEAGVLRIIVPKMGAKGARKIEIQ